MPRQGLPPGRMVRPGLGRSVRAREQPFVMDPSRTGRAVGLGATSLQRAMQETTARLRADIEAHQTTLEERQDVKNIQGPLHGQNR